MATQPAEAPGARSDVHSQPTGTSSGGSCALDRSLTNKRTVAADNTGVSDMEDELYSEPESPDVVSDWELLSDRDPAKDDELDQKLSEEANYRETMRGVRSLMGCTRYQTLIACLPHWTITPLPVPEPSLPGKYPSSYRLMTG